MKTRKKRKTYSQISQYDKIFKENIKAVTPNLIAKILKIKVVKEEVITTKLQHTKEREADFLKIVTDANGKKFVLHIEFQLAKDPKMKWRMLEYLVMLRLLYSDLEIVQYVIFIGEAANNFDSQINENNLHYSFEVVNIREIDYRHFLQTNIPEEIIFSVLADFQNENAEEVVETIIKEIKKHSKTQLQREKCFQQLRILSNIRNFTSLIEEIMEKVSMYFREEIDPWYKKGVSIGLNQGIEQGIEQGAYIKTYEFVVATIIKFPEWTNKLVADFVNIDMEFVQKVRTEMQNKND